MVRVDFGDNQKQFVPKVICFWFLVQDKKDWPLSLHCVKKEMHELQTHNGQYVAFFQVLGLTGLVDNMLGWDCWTVGA
jgi:hypothetical protein